jgi:hypothetical protein
LAVVVLRIRRRWVADGSTPELIYDFGSSTFERANRVACQPSCQVPPAATTVVIEASHVHRQSRGKIGAISAQNISLTAAGLSALRLANHQSSTRMNVDATKSTRRSGGMD